MSPDDAAPTTDWTRYGEPIDLANQNDSRAVVVGLVGDLAGPEPLHILELGCSAGMMTELMQAAGHRITAVEIDPVAAALAAPFADRLLVGDLDVVDPDGAQLLDSLRGESFDVLVAADVLEHLRDPAACLRRAVQLLRPDGTALLSIPNVAHADIRLALLDGHFDYRDNGLLDRTHTHLFTLESVTAMIRGAGLVPVAWHRTRRPMGESEIPIDENLLELGRRILAADPEATTYQWIITCRRADAEVVDAIWPELPARSPVVAGVLELMNTAVPHPVVVPRPVVAPHGGAAALPRRIRRVASSVLGRVGARRGP